MAVKKASSKKGFFFSFMALVFIILFIVMSSSKPRVTGEEQVIISQARMETVDTYTKNIADIYLQRALTSSANRAIEAMIMKITGTDPPARIDDAEAAFAELVLEGTLNGAPQAIMENNTLRNFSMIISQKTMESFGMDSDIEVFNVELWQEDPWRISASFVAHIRTNRSDIRFNLVKKITTNISIIGFYDPLLAYNGSRREIRMRESTVFDHAALKEMIDKREFKHHTEAPSFIMRLENRTGPSSCCGIESILNSSFSDRDCSYVDYLFLNNTCCSVTDIYNITGITDNVWPYRFVKLELGHIGPDSAQAFNVSGISEKQCGP